MNVNWKEVCLVAVSGAVGGLLSLIYSVTVGVPPVIKPFPVGFLAYLALGAAAGVFGVYLIAKTDTKQAVHCLVFAGACGFSWAPVFDGVSALVKYNSERAVHSMAAERVNETKRAILNLESVSDNELPATVASLVTKINDLLAIAPEVRDRQVSISVAQSVQEAFDTLQKVQPKNPTVISKATKEIAASVSASGLYGPPTVIPFRLYDTWSKKGEFAWDPNVPFREKDGGG